MKKKCLLWGAVFLTGLTAHATDYGYLTFQQSDGTLTSFVAKGLKMTFADGKLIATQGTRTASLDLASLSAMYFSNDGTATIQTLRENNRNVIVKGRNIYVCPDTDAKIELYSLDGTLKKSRQIGAGQTATLSTPVGGLYIVSVNGVKTKALVR